MSSIMTRQESTAGTTRLRQRMRAHRHRLVPLVPLLLGGLAMVGSYQLSLGELDNPGPGLWPFIVAAVVTITSLILVITEDPSEHESWTHRTAGIVGGLVSLGIFIVLFESIGFLIPAFFMLVLWLRVFGEEPWRWVVPPSIGGTIVMYVLFAELLGVPFPEDLVLSALSRIGV